MKLEIRNISKSFDSNLIINNVSLELQSNKIYGIVGRNGSGKSVLFKILCGLYKPDKGEMLLDGKSISTTNSFLPDTRVLIEKPNFLPDISGLENLKILAQIKNKINEKEILSALDVVNLSQDEYNKKFHKYSLGMKQKLGIAQVIMENPKIMILDEPFNGIENESIIKIKEYFKSLRNKDKIIIIASHIKEDIDDLCDEVYMIDGGKLNSYIEK